MRVLWVSHKAQIGGAELALAEGVEALARRNHESHVVLPRDGPLRHRLGSAAGVHICPHNPWTRGRHRLPLLTEARWLIYDWLVARREIARLAAITRVDVVVTNTITIPSGALAAQSARLPHVWFVHEFGVKERGVKFILGRRFTYRLMDRLSDLAVVASGTMHQHFAPCFRRSGVRRAAYAVPVGTPPGDRPAGDRPLRLVLLGVKTPAKGQHDAVRAVIALSREGIPVELDLVGPADPEYEQQLKEMAHASGVGSRIRFLPFDPHPSSAMARADVALMCSRDEPFGRVTIEAMKLGKPVIGAGSGATPELVRHGRNGFLYPPGDVSALSHWIQILDQDRGEAWRLGQRGQAWAAKTFTFESYGAALELALAEAAARYRARGPRASPLG